MFLVARRYDLFGCAVLSSLALTVHVFHSGALICSVVAFVLHCSHLGLLLWHRLEEERGSAVWLILYRMIEFRGEASIGFQDRRLTQLLNVDSTSYSSLIL